MCQVKVLGNRNCGSYFLRCSEILANTERELQIWQEALERNGLGVNTLKTEVVCTDKVQVFIQICED